MIFSARRFRNWMFFCLLGAAVFWAVNRQRPAADPPGQSPPPPNAAATAPTSANTRQAPAEPLATPVQATSPEPAAAPAYESPSVQALLAGATRLATKVQPLPDTRQVRERRLWQVPQFKYPLIREEILREAESGRVLERQFVVADHALMKFPAGMTTEQVRTWAERRGWKLRRSQTLSGIHLVALNGQRVPTLEAVEQLITSFEADFPANAQDASPAHHAEPDSLVFADTSTPNDPSFSSLWGLHNTGWLYGVVDADIDAPEAWAIHKGSREVVVGVIDSGLDTSHPDLAANVWRNPNEIPGNRLDDDENGYVDDVHGWDFYSGDALPNDPNGHGTHVAGTIGAVGNNGIGVTGVAWEVSLAGLRFLEASGTGTTSDAVEAVSYATHQKMTLTSNSWSGPSHSLALKSVIDDAGASGILFVAAAGNVFSNTDVRPQYPAAYPSSNIISVAATTQQDRLASYSNYGLVSVDLAAPGSEIYSTLPDGKYGLKSGTSMAAAYVTGALAVLKAHHPFYTITELKDRLLADVDRLTSLNGNCVTGGRLNLQRMLHNAPDAHPAVIASTWDDSSGGNGDGIFNPGETLQLNVTLMNRGTETGTGIRVQLELPESASGVQLMVPEVNLGSLQAGEVMPITPLALSVAPGAPTPQSLVLRLVVSHGLPEVSLSYDLPIRIGVSSRFAGRVTNAVTGEPVTAAEIHYSGPLTGSVETGPDGRYQTVVEEGVYQVWAVKTPSYARSPKQTVSLPPEQTDVDFTLGLPRLQTSPAQLQAELFSGNSTTQTLRLTNSGTGMLEWNLQPGEAARRPLVVGGRYPADPYYSYFKSGNPEFKEEILARGDEISLLRPPITTASLQGVNLFIIDDAMATAKPAEWTAILKAVEKGMNLVVTPRSETGHDYNLLKRFGVTRHSNFISIKTSTFLDHPVTSGIHSMALFATYLYQVTPGRATGLDVINSHPDYHTIAVSQSGISKLACLSGGLLEQKQGNLSTTTKRLIRQLLDWMSETPLWWSASPASGELPPGGTQEVVVHFNGSHQPDGTYTSSLALSDPPYGQSVTTPLKMVVKSGPRIVPEQDVLEFPDTLVGNTNHQDLELSNRGDQPVKLLGLLMPSSALSLKSRLPVTLAPGETVQLTVTFTPGVPGDFSGNLTGITNDRNSPILTIPMRGAARTGGRLIPQKDLLVLKSVTGIPTQTTLRLKNEGADPSFFHYIKTTNVTLEPSEGSVQPGQEIAIKATYTTAYSEPRSRQILSLTEEYLPGMKRTLFIPAITESAFRPWLQVAPQELNFGSIAVGGHAQRLLVLRNLGKRTVTLESVSLDGTDFTLANAPMPLTLAGGATHPLIVIWQPQKVGDVTGLLTLSTDDPAHPSVSLPLTGSAHAPATLHIVSDALNYSGALGVLDQSGRTVTLTNLGDVPLEWQAETEEPLASQFARLADPQNLDFLTAAIPNLIDVSSHAGSRFFNDWRRDGGVFRHTQFSTDLASSAEDYLPYSNPHPSHPQLGRGGNYHTLNHPKLFLFAADPGDARKFQVTGNLYPRFNARWNNEVLHLNHQGQPYLGLLMRNHSSNSTTNDCTSSLNHLIILPASQYLDHTSPSSTTSASHHIQLSPGAEPLYHLTFSTAIPTPSAPAFKSFGPFLQASDALNLMTRLLEAAGQRQKSPWLQASPSSGTLAAGQSVNVTIHASVPDAFILGTEQASLKVVTNDPLQPVVRFSAQMTMHQMPRLQITENPSIDFGEAPIGTAPWKSILVTNIGTAPLQLTPHPIDGASSFAYVGSLLPLDPGQSMGLAVRFTPEAVGTYAAELRLSSNDPNHPLVQIPLSGAARTPQQSLEFAPDPLVLTLAAGTTKTGSLTLTNSGADAYTWNARLDASLGYTPPTDHSLPAINVPALSQVWSKLAASSLTTLIPDRHSFTEGVVGFSIADGGDDMYDEGNLIFTNLSNGANLRYSNNVIDSSPVFGTLNGNYFTRKSDGLFVLAADLAVSEFRIAGGLGADGAGAVSTTVLQRTKHGRNYSGFVKRVHGAGSIPSVNHLIIVESNESIGHDYALSTDDDAHRVFGLENTDRLYYLLFASRNGRLVTDAETGELMDAFLDLLASSPEDAIRLVQTTGVLVDSASVSVEVDARLLPVGTYQTELTVESPHISRTMPVIVQVTDEPALSVSASELNFPDTLEVSSLNLILTNRGLKPLTLHSLSLPSEAFSCHGLAPPLSLAPGASTTLHVRFHPASAGIFTASLGIGSDSFEKPLTVIPLQGRGVSRPVPHLLQHGEPLERLRLATTEAAPAWAEFTLQNLGDIALDWSAPTPMAAWQPGTTPALAASLSPATGSVPAGGSVIVRVETPTRNLPPGVHTTEIVIHSQGTAAAFGTLRLPLELQIEAAPAAILETPRLDFGALRGGSRTLALSVMSDGSEVLEITGITLPGQEFTCGTDFPLQLAKGERAVLTVRYTPLNDHIWDSSLILHTNDPAQRELAVPISAEGIFPGSLRVNPGSLAFRMENETSAGLSLELHNAGQRTLSWTVDSVAGISAPATLEQVLVAIQTQVAGITQNIPGIIDFPGGTSGITLTPWNYHPTTTNGIRFPSADWLVYSSGQILETNFKRHLARYFTLKSTGFWVMAADLDDPGHMTLVSRTTPDLEQKLSWEIMELQMQGHVGFCQSTHYPGRPSMNHIFIVPERAGLSHRMINDPSWQAEHEIHGLAGKTRAYQVFFATSPDVNNGRVDKATFTAVMRAFLEALPSPWLTVSPFSGTLPGGGTAHLTVNAFDPGWAQGTYNGHLNIHAPSDPGEPTGVSIPVSLALAGSQMQQLLAHPDRPEMYALLRGDRLQVLDSLTGELRTEVPLPPATTRLALAPDGNSLWGLSVGNRQIWHRPLPISDTLATWQIPTAGYASEGDHLAVTRTGLVCLTDGRTGSGPTLLQLRQADASPHSVRNLEGLDLAGLAASRLKQELWGWSQHSFQDNRSCRLVRLPVAGSGFGKPQVLPVPLLAERADARVWLTRQEDAVFAKNHRYSLPALGTPAVVFAEVIETISPDGSLAVGENHLFDGRTGELLTSFEETSRIAAFSHDGSRLWRWSRQNQRLEVSQLGAMDIRWLGQPVVEHLDFGRAVVGGAVSRTLTLRNVGGLALADIALSVEGTHGDEVRLQAVPAQTLARGDATTCTLTFRAAEAGLRTAVLKLRSSDPTTPEVTLQLTLLAQIETAPLVIDSPPQDQLVRQGEAALFHLGVSGVGPMTFEWQKGSKRQAVTQEPAWGIPLVTASHAGDYTARVLDGHGGSLTSAPARLVVYEPVSSTARVMAGGVLQLAGKLWGEGGSLQWHKDGVPLLDDDRISGSRRSALRISAARPEDAGQYTLTLSLGGLTRLAATCEVTVTERPRLLDENLGPWSVGAPVHHALAASTPSVRFKATGLPPGIKLNSATGLLSGRPTRHGNFQVAIQALHPAGASPVVTLPVQVVALPDAAQGSFVGLLARSNGFDGGLLTLQVSSTGACSGLVRHDLYRMPLKGSFEWQPGWPHAVANFTHTYSDKTNLALIVRLPVTDEHAPFDGEVKFYGGTNRSYTSTSLPLQGYRTPWSAKNPCLLHTGLWNARIVLPEVLTGLYPYPQGEGKAQTKIQKTGQALWAARLANGNKVTASSPISLHGRALFYAFYKKSSFHSLLVDQLHDITSSPPKLDGTLDWFSTYPNQTVFPPHIRVIQGGLEPSSAP